jgi:hypothetical protein
MKRADFPRAPTIDLPITAATKDAAFAMTWGTDISLL